MTGSVVSGTGLCTPAQTISNDELVASFNEYVRRTNATHAEAIAAGSVTALQPSSAEFIVKASGVKNRHVIDKAGLLDPKIMCPRIPERSNGQLSVSAEMAAAAGRDALVHARREARDIDAVIVSCANLERPYPAIAIEVQDALGIEGFGFDMNVGCSSAAFA
ncbi:MAG TPA: beta-ketoacyl-ACP synthase III, partial [Rhizomicrobium sp.]